MDNIFPQEEPSAAAREASSGLRQLFVAMVQQGFTEAQALHIIGVAVASAVQKGDGTS